MSNSETRAALLNYARLFWGLWGRRLQAQWLERETAGVQVAARRLNVLYPTSYSDIEARVVALLRLNSGFLREWDQAFKPHANQQMLLAFSFEVDQQSIAAAEGTTLVHDFCTSHGQIANYDLEQQAARFAKQLQRLCWAFSNEDKLTLKQIEHLVQALDLVVAKLPQHYLPSS